MSYQTYTTDALVCGSYDRKTSDRSHLLFTRDAGMLYADARSVREERSKQRYALQEFSLIRVSLVRGKGGWRVGSVESRGNVYYGVTSREARGAVVRVVRLLRRFVHGDDVHASVYETVEWACTILQSDTVIDHELLLLFVELKVLAALGYIADNAALKPFLALTPYEVDFVELREYQQLLKNEIDTASTASHL